MLSLYEILKASKTGIAPDMWTALAGMNWGGKDSGAEVKKLTGIPPLSIRSNGTMLLDYLISGNMSQSGTPTPTTPIQPQECGERTGNLWRNSNVWSNSNTDTKDYFQLYIRFYSGSTLVGESISNIRSNGYKYLSAMPQQHATRIQIKHNGTATDLVIGNVYGEFTANVPLTLSFVVNGYNPTIIDGISLSDIMLNTGSTALPYEPYGYKIPISSGGENLFVLPNVTQTIDNVEYVISNGVIKATGETTAVARNDTAALAMDGLHRITDYPNYTAINPQYALSLSVGTYYFKNTTISGPSYFISLLVGVSGGSVNQGTARRITAGHNFTVGADEYVMIILEVSTSYTSYESKENMLNLGSEPLPYSPYNRTTTPIYLGEVPTTRKIKKLVLDGTERWEFFSDNTGAYSTWQFYVNNITNGLPMSSVCSNIAGYGVTATTRQKYLYGAYLVTSGTGVAFQMAGAKDTFTNITAWKSYLAAQYAAGTPVCVWYVLAEPTTGIVNEPLRKIGDYADTLSMEQAGVQIPTLHGNTVIDVETTLKPSQMYIKYQE